MAVFAVSALVFCFWVDGRSPKLSPSNTPRSLRIKFEKVIDHATARRNVRRKIVREDSDGRRLIIELEQIVVHACWKLPSWLASESSCRAFREPTAGATWRALAEFERELIVERTRAGMAAARARGRPSGRPYKMTAAKRRLAAGGDGEAGDGGGRAVRGTGDHPPDAVPPRRLGRFDPPRRSEAATSPEGVNSDHLEADFYRFVAFSASATKLSIILSGVLLP